MITKQIEPLLLYDDSDKLIDKILSVRGIPKDLRKDFLNPTSKYLHNPFELENMRKAVERVLTALQHNQKIIIYGDPDCDGITSTALCYNYLENFTDNVHYILHQRKEGHGVKPKYIPNDCDLLIIVDSSTNSTNECCDISKICDIIILDHHEKSDNVEENIYATIVNPQICSYHNKNLSGAGVVFQFCRAIDMTQDLDIAKNYSDLACVGLIGDMMSVKNMENRYIIKMGLDLIKQGNIEIKGNLGLFEIFREYDKNENPTALDIGFYIAPCINAIIRLKDINDLMKLFTCTKELDCIEMVKDIKEQNDERKKLTKDIMNDIIKSNMINDDKVIIVNATGKNFSKNLNGLIANQISREYQRPCFVGKVAKGYFVGSARGFGYRIDFRQKCNDSKLFDSAEGHSNSFGVKFKFSNKQEILNHFNREFKDEFNEIYCEYDLAINYKDLSYDNLKDMDRLANICGQQFKKPIFLIKGLMIDDCDKLKEAHIKLIKQDDMNLNIMKFNTTDSVEKYIDSDYMDVIGTVGINSYKNKYTGKLIESRQVLSDVIECHKF